MQRTRVHTTTQLSLLLLPLSCRPLRGVGHAPAFASLPHLVIHPSLPPDMQVHGMLCCHARCTATAQFTAVFLPRLAAGEHEPDLLLYLVLPATDAG